MFRLSLKSRPDRSDESRHVAAFLKARVVDLLRLSDEDRVTVNEIVCADLGCPEIETIILVMRGGERTRA